MDKIIISVILIGSLIIILILTSLLNRKMGSSEELKGFKGNCQTCGQTNCSLHPEYDDNNNDEEE